MAASTSAPVVSKLLKLNISPTMMTSCSCLRDVDSNTVSIGNQGAPSSTKPQTDSFTTFLRVIRGDVTSTLMDGGTLSLTSIRISVAAWMPTRSQLVVLLEAIHMGDGTKQPKNVSWTQRSYHIATPIEFLLIGSRAFVFDADSSAMSLNTTTMIRRFIVSTSRTSRSDFLRDVMLLTVLFFSDDTTRKASTSGVFQMTWERLSRVATERLPL